MYRYFADTKRNSHGSRHVDHRGSRTGHCQFWADWSSSEFAKPTVGLYTAGNSVNVRRGRRCTNRQHRPTRYSGAEQSDIGPGGTFASRRLHVFMLSVRRSVSQVSQECVRLSIYDPSHTISSSIHQPSHHCLCVCEPLNNNAADETPFQRDSTWTTNNRKCIRCRHCAMGIQSIVT